MFANLRLGPNKGLQTCELKGLRRVNVICGRNNSGKSSVLEAILDERRREVGESLDEKALSNILARSVGRTIGEFTLQDYRARWPGLTRRVEEVAEASDIWFKGQAREFSSQLEQRGAISDARIPSIQTVQEAFNDIFEPSLSWITGRRAVFLAPNRTVVATPNLATSHILENTPHSLVAYLFYAKNLIEDAPDAITYRAIEKAFEQVSDGYHFGVFVDERASGQLVLRFRAEGQPWRDADACGLGLRDSLYLIAFCAHPDIPLVLIEEPEEHLHPTLQRRFLEYISGQVGKQFFLSTHSNVFLDRTFVDRIFYTSYENGQVRLADRTTKAEMLGELGYSVTDNLAPDAIILTEGPTDVPILEELLNQMGIYGKYDIKFWPLGGNIMNKVDLSVVTQGARVWALIDLDPESAHIREEFETQCEDHGVPLHRLSRYAIENYIPIEAYRGVFAGQVPEGIDSIDPTKSVKSQLGFNPKRHSRELARAISLKQLEGTDLEEFLNRVASDLRS